MVFTVFSMVFTSSVEVAFRRDAILKAQSSKALYSLYFKFGEKSVWAMPVQVSEGCKFQRRRRPLQFGVICGTLGVSLFYRLVP